SQVALHHPYGGVVPELASRAHLRNVVPVIEQAVKALPRGFDDVDAIAVTNGPGLVGALLVGVSAAKAIAWSRGLPIVGVNHLVAHLLAVYLRRDEAPPVALPMPYVALLASGGHTALYRVDSHADIVQLGETRDDAAGEAYDKVAKLLGLGYPGGPIVDRLAAQGDPNAVPLTRPMRGKHGLAFSFSGLKTAVAQHVQKHGIPREPQAQADLCASFQRAVVGSLVEKSLAACEREGVPRLVLGGGVAANRGLRALAAERCAKKGIALHVPPFASCTDNAAMIAYAGAQRLVAGERDTLELSVFSRAPVLEPTLKSARKVHSA
ncbi:MAG TPA: tRNA (adenosine(37)-N6)-threonylcarbamoyltransferase complex transferase subunit TsaD, partial [Polyangiales bacterium]